MLKIPCIYYERENQNKKYIKRCPFCFALKAEFKPMTTAGIALRSIAVRRKGKVCDCCRWQKKGADFRAEMQSNESEGEQCDNISNRMVRAQLEEP